MSCKHNRWDRRWLISSVQIEWQSVAQMIKSRERAGEKGEIESLCFLSSTLDSILRIWQRPALLTACRTENTFISHTKASHCVASTSVITLLSNTNHWNHLSSLEWLRMAEHCHLPQVLWQGGLKKMQITYHTPHTSLKLFFLIFFSSSELVITDWLVFLVISFGGE